MRKKRKRSPRRRELTRRCDGVRLGDLLGKSCQVINQATCSQPYCPYKLGWHVGIVKVPCPCFFFGQPLAGLRGYRSQVCRPSQRNWVAEAIDSGHVATAYGGPVE